MAKILIVFQDCFFDYTLSRIMCYLAPPDSIRGRQGDPKWVLMHPESATKWLQVFMHLGRVDLMWSKTSPGSGTTTLGSDLSVLVPYLESRARVLV